MEHLVHRSSARAFRTEVRDVAVSLPVAHDRGQKSNQYQDTVTPTGPSYKWLGHPHEQSSYFQHDHYDMPAMIDLLTDYYGLEWNDILACDDLCSAHSSLAQLDAFEASHQVAAYVQAWLFFGLLEAICGRAIPTSLMVRSDHENSRSLYTLRLAPLLESWRRGLSRDSQLFQLQQARDCAQYASSIFNELFDKFRQNDDLVHKDFCKALLSMEPALSALHEFIGSFVEYHSENEIRSFNQRPTSPFPREYSSALIRKGWCPFVIATAETNMFPSFLRFVDVSGYRLIDGGHQLCNSDLCKRNQVIQESYTQRHRTPRCRCEFVKPDRVQVFEILDAAKIPVVQYEPEEGTIELGGVDPEQKSDYIVFSHVWADGLGSCTERGLPRCQVERLHNLASQELKCGSWFWIDGLCVPKREPYRNLAIQLMKSTYRNATGGVVLDNSLHEISTSYHPMHIGWTVYASGWMGRLWTYQEGILPPWIDLELNDGLCSLYQLIQQLYRLYNNKSMESPVPAILARDLLAALQKARPLDRHHQSRERSRKVVDVFNALTRRLTSRPEDQLLVLALLLDVDVNNIMALSGEARWRQFYLSLQEVPWTIVFDRRPKLSRTPGFSWAPATWISSGKDEYLHYDEALATCTDDGLRVTTTVLMLDDICESAEPYILILIGAHLYELARSVDSARDNAASSLQRPYNMLFIRHFKHETPQTHLHGNSSVWLRVGAGLLARSSEQEQEIVWYDFQIGWDIRWLERPDDEVVVAQGMASCAARWEERVCLFT